MGRVLKLFPVMKRNIWIIYFSPTGGCRKLAVAIEKALVNDHVTVTDLTPPLARETCRVSLNCDCLIAVLPVYAQDLPDCLTEFLSRLQGDATPAIIISEYGNVHSGRALYRAAGIMSGRGFKIMGAVTCPAAHAYNHGSLSLAPDDPDDSAAMQITRFIESLLKQHHSGNFSFLEPRVLRAPKNIFAYLPQKLLAHLAVKKPDRAKALCNGCNSCVTACPVSAINRSLEIDNQLCIRCCACVKACKQSARRIVFTSPFPYLYLGLCGKQKRDLCFYKAAP